VFCRSLLSFILTALGYTFNIFTNVLIYVCTKIPYKYI
jgi:hypothetical protein